MLYRLGIPWGIYRDVYSLSHFTTYPLSTGQCLVGTFAVLTNSISLGIFLKCLEDTSEEVCDADGTVEPEVEGGEGGERRDLRTDGRSFKVSRDEGRI